MHQLKNNWRKVWFKTCIFAEISELWLTNKMGHICINKGWATSKRCHVGYRSPPGFLGDCFHPPWIVRKAGLCSIFLSEFQPSWEPELDDFTSWEPLNTSRLHQTYVMYVYKFNWLSWERLGVQFLSTKGGLKTCILAKMWALSSTLRRVTKKHLKLRLLLRSIAYDTRSLSGSLRDSLPSLRLDLRVGLCTI